jgi:hypothetical protein
MQTAAGFEPREDEDYASLVKHLVIDVPLFTTDAEGLYDAFLAAIPAPHRQTYTCRTCRSFVNRYGGLVAIDESGFASSPFWDGSIPRFFLEPVGAISQIVGRARTTGVFLTTERVLGSPQNASPKGTWRHMHATVRPAKKSALQTAEQQAAEKREDYGTLCRGLAEFPIDVVRRAYALLTTGGLYRSEKCISFAKWLLDLHEAREATKNARIRENITWRAVALAPPGFCHVRSTMIGTLLEDLAAGMDFETVKKRFDEKMHPLQYQRPQAAPTDGQLAAAEKVVEKLASAGSLVRRFASLEDIADDAVWMPKERSDSTDRSVFGHLRSDRSTSAIDVPKQTMTWDKFWRTVLPEAESIECLVPHRGDFFAFLTAADMGAPPILQWDRDDSRNPVSWYVYHGGSSASQWGLSGGAWAKVQAITTQPSSWGGGSDHQGNGAYVVLDGARDSKRSGLALFSETLKSEYHAIRAAIEAYSRSGQLVEVDHPACGIAFQKANSRWSCDLRVTSRGTRVIYSLDRWD